MRDDNSAETRLYFRFTFAAEAQALAFVRMLEPGSAASMMYAANLQRWQVVVQRRLPPLHSAASAALTELNARAATVGGEENGWGKDGI